MTSPAEVRELLQYLDPKTRAELYALLNRDKTLWRPLPGPQSMAYHLKVDVLGFGGAAGGGKSDLAIGKALTQFDKTAYFRREGTELTAVEDRIEEILGHKDNYNGQKRIWRPMPDVQIEFGSVPNLGDERKYQGRPRSLLVIDEAANWLEQQVRFLMGWVRTTKVDQRTQTLLCFNPPTNAEGRWIIKFFAPWLDDKYPAPAAPGEIRYFVMIDGEEREWPDGMPFTHKGELVTPQSRSFVPSRITDNPYLMGTGYMATLQAMPEPLRSQMLYGDFKAGMEDDAMQVIPTAWVEAAQARWTKKDPKPEMDSVGVDVARGGKDETVISRRHGWWFDELLAYAGKSTPDGPSVAGVAIATARDVAPIHVDIIGVGASPYDFLKAAGVDVFGVNVAEACDQLDKSGKLKFFNLRSYLWWRMRELLDPTANNGIALPPDSRLLADLTAPKWELRTSKIYVQGRDDLLKTLGRSPDYASAVILASLETPKAVSPIRGGGVPSGGSLGHDPFAFMSRE